MSDSEEIGELLTGPRLPSHLYVHVPFCRSKCAYCDFYSLPAPPADLVLGVFDGIEGEVGSWASANLPGVLETVYVGGGTPSAWPASVASLLHLVRGRMLIQADAEITVEANPDSLDGATLDMLVAAGANRISVGVQSFDDAVLRLLGRRHDAASAKRAARLVSGAGIELSVDLMCGVPGQTLTSWTETLEHAAQTGARHMSVYPLSIEEGTALDVAVSGGLVDAPDPDMAAEMMVIAEAFLEQRGIRRYEVANYAGRGHESRHNRGYWTGESYIGVGPGAHGMLDAETGRVMGVVAPDDLTTVRVRYADPADVEEWLVRAAENDEYLDAAAAAREDVMLGLRLVAGVPVAQVEAAGLSSVLESLASDGLVERAGTRWRTTRRGWLLGNQVFGRVWNAG
jgi:putative oxygen-independent coproporphyrinogen III oxidase